jgi:hypothetical protein
MNPLKEFKEIQNRKPWYVWLAPIIINGFMGYALFSQLVWKQPVGNNPASDPILILIALLVLLFTILLMSIRLETKINEEGIEARFFPFHIKSRKFSWSEIEKSYLRTYKPIKEYGGWGIKGTRKNIAYNYSGKTGLQLELKNGRRVLIGTKMENDIERVLIELGKLSVQ